MFFTKSGTKICVLLKYTYIFLFFFDGITTFAPELNKCSMSYTEKITIKNPSRKLEEKVRKIGVQKYLWLEKLCSDDTMPTHIVKV